VWEISEHIAVEVGHEGRDAEVKGVASGRDVLVVADIEVAVVQEIDRVAVVAVLGNMHLAYLPCSSDALVVKNTHVVVAEALVASHHSFPKPVNSPSVFELELEEERWTNSSFESDLEEGLHQIYC
jgi:hypothetical protein